MRNRPALIAVSLVTAVFVFYYYFLEPKAELIAESIESGYAALRKEEKLILRAQTTGMDAKAAAEEMKKIERGLVQEKTEFLAAARLQGEVTDLAKKAGLRVLTIRPLGKAKVNKYSSLPVYLEGNGTIKQVSDFLKAVEADSILLKIDKLGLNITNVQNPKELKFKIQVSGLAQL